MNNKTVFESHGAAKSFAELESKKKFSELFVVKSHAGGINYYVTSDVSKLAAGEKILDRYKNGIVVTGREKEEVPATPIAHAFAPVPPPIPEQPKATEPVKEEEIIAPPVSPEPVTEPQPTEPTAEENKKEEKKSGKNK
jgi:hypothetical protein